MKKKAVHKVGQYIKKDDSWLRQDDMKRWLLGCEECGRENKAAYCVVGYEEDKNPVFIKPICRSCSLDYTILENLGW